MQYGNTKYVRMNHKQVLVGIACLQSVTILNCQNNLILSK